LSKKLLLLLRLTNNKHSQITKKIDNDRYTGIDGEYVPTVSAKLNQRPVYYKNNGKAAIWWYNWDNPNGYLSLGVKIFVNEVCFYYCS